MYPLHVEENRDLTLEERTLVHETEATRMEIMNMENPWDDRWMDSPEQNQDEKIDGLLWVWVYMVFYSLLKNELKRT